MQESLLQRDAFRLRWKDETEAAVLRAQDECSTYKKEQTPRSSARLVMAMDRLRPDSAEETQSRPAMACNAKCTGDLKSNTVRIICMDYIKWETLCLKENYTLFFLFFKGFPFTH